MHAYKGRDMLKYKGRDMLKAWVGYSSGQDFINIFLTSFIYIKKIILDWVIKKLWTFAWSLLI